MSLNNNGINAIVSTLVLIPSTDSEYSIPGDMTPAQVRTSYSTQIPGLSAMDFTERTVPGTSGSVREITFKPRTGTKGAVVSTLVLIPSTDSEYSIPGDMTPAQVRTSYSTQIPGLSAMDFTERSIPGNNGTVREITFKPRTGTKGNFKVSKLVVAVRSTFVR